MAKCWQQSVSLISIGLIVLTVAVQGLRVQPAGKAIKGEDLTAKEINNSEELKKITLD